jgi:tRNA threonylcarbamoyladenosine biosynthesis protein TsaB
MLILAFESSAKSASVALWRDGALLAEYFQNSGQTHSRTLTKMAEDMLQNCDLTVGEVDAVACAAGPGSFTGVRIGVAAAKGFAWAAEKPCVGVSTLEAMATGLTLGPCILCPVMDARRSQVYNAVFRVENGTLTRLAPDRAIAVEDLLAELQSEPLPKILVGDGAQLCYNQDGGRTAGLQLAPPRLRLQRASGVAQAAEQLLESGNVPPAADLVPNYLRLSQAERERLARENS